MGGDVSGVDLDQLRAAYESVTIGSDGPTRMIVQGAVLLHFRPDLVESVQADRTYLIWRSSPGHLTIEEVVK